MVFKRCRPISSASWLALMILLGACSSADQGNVAETANSRVLAETMQAKSTEEQLERMADQAMHEGDVDSATLLYSQALSENSSSNHLAIKLGEALYADNRLDEALGVFRSVLARDPDHADASRGFAKVQIALDRPQTAEDQLLRSLREHGDDAEAWTTLGVARDLRGDHGGAREAYERVIELRPGDLSARNNRALSLALDGDLTQAILELRRITEGPEANPQSRQNLAFVYALAGDLGNAERLSYVDLNEAAVENNMEIFARLKGPAPQAEPSRALKPAPSQTAPQGTSPVQSQATSPANPAPSQAVTVEPTPEEPTVLETPPETQLAEKNVSSPKTAAVTSGRANVKPSAKLNGASRTVGLAAMGVAPHP